MTSPRIAIAGASLAGVRTAEALRAALPNARIVLVGEERHAPYNRPPLSKDAIEGLASGHPSQEQILEKLLLRSKLSPGDVDLRLGRAVVSVESGQLRLADGARVSADWIIAATGLRPRHLPQKGAEERRYVLRGFDDACRLAGRLRAGSRMAVIGGGFIGCEIASTACKLGLHVTIVEPEPQPMLHALGTRVAAAMGNLHRRRGVRLLTGRRVHSFSNGNVVLDDGEALEADVIVEALGTVPNTEWLTGTGVDLSDGVLVDDRMIAAGSSNMLAVGDIARFANLRFDATCRRVEHWCVPGQTARRAAETISALSEGRSPSGGFAPMPSFWSEQHGMRLQSFGAPALADTQTVIEGDLSQVGEAPIIVEYARRGELVAVVGLGARPNSLARHHARLDKATIQTMSA
ncbi:NAD(P)/FAD-dependent oxidoreductase [Salinihabitans flavidus]|nr:FAD-dependent oxidoreductase [Salinihabitans flavidus]